MILRRHPATTGDQFASLIDVLNDRMEVVACLQIDTLADMGLPAELLHRLNGCEQFRVQLVGVGRESDASKC